MAEDPRAKYGLSCPLGGSFYICGASETQFIGCCDHDPCTDEADGICEDDALHPASFSATNYIDIPPQNCVRPYNESTWWTCQNARPPFLGCCGENPCNAGCSEADLLPARLSDNETNAAPFLVTTSTSPTSSSSTSAPTSSSPTTSADASTSDEAVEGSPTGLIVGVTMGGLVVLFLGIAAFLWTRRRKEKQRVTEKEDGVQNQPQTPDVGGGSGGGDQPTMLGPQYSPYKDSYPSTVHSSPFPYQSSIGMVSPPMSTASTCWSPRDARHISQLSELSGDDYVHELPDPNGLQTVPELDGSGRQGGGEQNEGPPGGTTYVLRGGGDNSTAGQQYHELDTGRQ